MFGSRDVAERSLRVIEKADMLWIFGTDGMMCVLQCSVVRVVGRRVYVLTLTRKSRVKGRC
eukprot:6936242-Prymnesium_polylepis.1